MHSSRPFAETLSRILRDQDVSQREVARRTQAKYHWGGSASLHLLASGQMRPTPDAMEKIAKVLAVDPEIFAEYRLWKFRSQFDPDHEGNSLAKALRNLERFTGPSEDVAPHPAGKATRGRRRSARGGSAESP